VPTSWTAAESQPDLFEQRPQPARSVGVALRQVRGLLNEGLPRTSQLVTAKAANPQIDDRLPTGDRQITEIALVTAVERFRPGTAIPAISAGGFTADHDVDNLVAQLYLLDNEPFALRQ